MIRGAEVVRSYLVEDSYVTEMRQDEILVAVGYASVSEQTGRTVEEKRVRAMRACRY